MIDVSYREQGVSNETLPVRHTLCVCMAYLTGRPVCVTLTDVFVYICETPSLYDTRCVCMAHLAGRAVNEYITATPNRAGVSRYDTIRYVSYREGCEHLGRSI